MQLSELTWTAVDEQAVAVAVLPVGSTEQHGPHAPLGTDIFTAAAVAEAGIQRSDQDVLVAPSIPVGVAEEHRHFAGTLWVSEDTFRSYIHDVVTSLASHGCSRVVIVNGHGGNVDALREVSARLSRDDVAYTVPFTWFDAIDIQDTGLDPSLAMGHGGPFETSLLLHIAPDLVHEDRFDEARDGAADQWGDWQAGTNLAYDSAEFTETGVVGDPNEASETIGEQLLEAAAAELAGLIETVATRDRSTE